MSRKARLRARSGETDGALADIDDAIALATEVGNAPTLVFATLRRALLDPRRVEEAERCFAEHAGRLSQADAMEARFELWRVTKSRGHLDEAARLLRGFLDPLPEETRRRSLLLVPRHRAIATAAGWELPAESG